MLCGGLTGMVATFLTYPLDVIKTFHITHSECSEIFCKHTRNMIKEGGLSRLYSGVGVSLCGVPLYIGLRMSTYDQLSSTYEHKAKTDR